MRNEVIEARDAKGRGLRVEFTWHGDRFQHVISAIAASGEIQPLLESIEGSPVDDWPPSPPLQSVSIEMLPDGRRAALLIGMAGGSHWSASIEAALGQPELLFDLACRHSKRPRRLGSHYHRLPGSAERLTLRGEEARVGDDEAVVAIEPLKVDSSSGTARWKFAIGLARSEG